MCGREYDSCRSALMWHHRDTEGAPDCIDDRAATDGRLGHRSGGDGRPARRKNGWQLAEEAGNPTPYGMNLLCRARWAAAAVRDELRAYVLEWLGDQDAVLVVDETDCLKKETTSVGLKRLDDGTAGRIATCKVGVFQAHASDRGRAFIDRKLSLSAEWAGDRARRTEASVSDAVRFAAKPELAEGMLRRALDGGVPKPSPATAASSG
jgi:hypothetical protein